MSNIQNKISNLKKRIDGTWSNIFTGLGGKADKNKYLRVNSYNRKDDTDLVNQYAQDGLCAKIVDYLPEQMLKKHICINHDKAKDIENKFYNELNLDYKILQALRWSRLFGGAVIIPRLNVNDLSMMATPFNINEITSDLKESDIIVLDRRYIRPLNYDNPLYLPELYQVEGLDKSFYIHKSRLIIFDGIDVTIDMRMSNQGWGESVINRIDDGLKSWGVGFCSSLAHLIQELKTGVLKLQGLNDKIAQSTDEAEQETITKLSIINMSKGIINGMVMDKEDDFINVPVSLTGLKELLQGIKDLISTLSGIPHDRLFNESPGASLGEGGKNQTINFYDSVKQAQNTYLSSQMGQLLQIVFYSMGIMEKPEFYFPDLYELDEVSDSQVELNEAQAEKYEAEKYSILIDKGIYTAQEVRAFYDEEMKEDE